MPAVRNIASVALLIAGAPCALAQGSSTAAGLPTAKMQIGAAASGVVSKILVRDGEQVSAGQLILTLDCRPLAAEMQVRKANAAAAEAAAQRTRNGPRLDEIAIGVAGVGVAQARAEEAQAAYLRTTSLREGIESIALVLQARRDARITAAQLEDAKKKLDLLHAGSRQEDIAEADARRDAMNALVEQAALQLDQCSVRAPVPGQVKVLASLGQFVSTAVPVTLAELTPSGAE